VKKPVIAIRAAGTYSNKYVSLLFRNLL